MKRIVLLAAVTAAAVAPAMVSGCGSKMNSPFEKKVAATPKANYFEVKKNKVTYVLASAESIQALNKGEKLPLKEMPTYGPKGETVAFETNSYTDLNRLIAEYRKSHNMP